jgi:hypothetical protein
MADISPDLFMDAVLAYQQTAAIKAALELDLFSEIAKGNATAESLAQTSGAAVRGVRILCDYLTARGHIEKQADKYRLTQSTAAFLDRRAPSWMGSVVEYLAAPEMMALFLGDPAGNYPKRRLDWAGKQCAGSSDLGEVCSRDGAHPEFLLQTKSPRSLQSRLPARCLTSPPDTECSASRLLELWQRRRSRQSIGKPSFRLPETTPTRRECRRATTV